MVVKHCIVVMVLVVQFDLRKLKVIYSTYFRLNIEDVSNNNMHINVNVKTRLTRQNTAHTRLIIQQYVTTK